MIDEQLLQSEIRKLEVKHFINFGLSKEDAEFVLDPIECNQNINDILECIEGCSDNKALKRYIMDKKIVKMKAQNSYIKALNEHHEQINKVLSKLSETIYNSIQPYKM